MFGLPMSLNENFIQEYGEVRETDFEFTAAYEVKIILKKELFSNEWTIFVARDNFRFLGIEFTLPDEARTSERLVFSGQFHYGVITIPRYHHWYDLSAGEYVGSDIILKALD